MGTDTTWAKIVNGNSQGDSNVLAIKTNGTLWTWGWQYTTGSIGLNEGGVTRYSSPTQVGTEYYTGMVISVTNQDNVLVLYLKLMEHYGDGEMGVMDKLGLGICKWTG